MAAKQILNISSLLECPICLSECEDPRALPCLHSLCKKCLQDHIKTSAHGSHFNCPSCRHQCEVPPGGVSALPKNFMFNSLKQMLQQQSLSGAAAASSSKEPLVTTGVIEQECCNNNMGNVKHTAATVFCVDCAEFFCSHCETSHKTLSISRGHRLRPAGNVDASDGLTVDTNTPTCDQHRNQFIDMYCETCSVPLCIKCCLQSHQQHKYHELDQKAEESEEQLVELASAATNLINRLDLHLEEIDASQVNMEKEGKEACEQVSKTADELRAIITNRERSLIEDILDSQKTALIEVRAAHKEAELKKAGVQSLHSYIRALQVSGDVTDQVVHTPGLQEQLRQQEAAPLLPLTWTVHLERETPSVAAVNTMLGTVSVNQTVATPGVIPDDMKVALSSPVLSLKPDVGDLISGLAAIGDCVCVTGWCQPYLWIHNMKTNTNKRHTLDGLCAVGMTAMRPHNNTTNNNTLAITCNNKKLHFITISPQNMSITKHTIKNVPFEACHVSVDPICGKLIIANLSDEQIVIIDNTGNIEKRVTVESYISGNMWCGLATDDGYIILDCTNPGLVHWMNTEGAVIHTYGRRDGEGLNNPWHMALDCQGRLVVADNNNHRLHLIDVNRQMSHYLLTEKDGIKAPTCICLDETTGLLFVGHRDVHNVRTVSVYKWPFTATSTPGTHHTLTLRLNRYK